VTRSWSPLMLNGVGIALRWGLMDGLAVSVVPSERTGMAVGIFNTTRVACKGVALAIAMATLSGFTAAQLTAQGWRLQRMLRRQRSCW
jgi:hypothetical protein